MMEMDILEAMKARHSVRTYTDRKIEEDVEKELRKIIEECNNKVSMNIQLCLDEPQAFDNFMAHYGKFKNVNNYIAIVAKKGKDFEEKAGYYGEKIVLKAAQLGLNTCWVALTFSKSKTNCKIEKGEKLHCVIALGYGETPGITRKTKSIEELCNVDGEIPDWFKRGMEATQLAPTATNQQKFLITLDGNVVRAKALRGFYTKLDLGIVKYHFEVGAGINGWKWDKV